MAESRAVHVRSGSSQAGMLHLAEASSTGKIWIQNRINFQVNKAFLFKELVLGYYYWFFATNIFKLFFVQLGCFLNLFFLD